MYLIINGRFEAVLVFFFPCLRAIEITATNLRSGALQLTLTPDLLEKAPSKKLFAYRDQQCSDGSPAKVPNILLLSVFSNALCSLYVTLKDFI